MAGKNFNNLTSHRLIPLDALRGFIILVMALDHANYFVAQQHVSGEYWGGPFPSYDSLLPFLTRLVTHLAAPGFFLLMGTSMVLFAHSKTAQGWSRWQISRHFVIRGLLLMALQVIVINRAWELSPNGWVLDWYIGVLFALGGAMLLATLFLWLNDRQLITLTTILFIAVGILHPNPSQWGMIGSKPLSLIFILSGGDRVLWSNYPIIPWLPAVFLGLLLGNWLVMKPEEAYQRGLKIGLTFLLAFIMLRFMDGFGNIRVRAGNSWIDFLNLVKYPPSLNFLLLTLGVNLVTLWTFSYFTRFGTTALRLLAVFGRTPLFFYLVHLFLYAFLGRLLKPEGSSIPAMIPIWLLGLVTLWPLCASFYRLKANRSFDVVLRYI